MQLLYPQDKPREFDWQVEVIPPGGRSETFTARFIELPTSEINTDGPVTDGDLVRRVLIGWSGITDEKGEELPFNEENLEIFLDRPCCAHATAIAYYVAVRGVRDRGN